MLGHALYMANHLGCVSDELENLRRYMKELQLETLLIKRLILKDIVKWIHWAMKQLMGMRVSPRNNKSHRIEVIAKPLPLGPWNFGWDEKVIKMAAE